MDVGGTRVRASVVGERGHVLDTVSVATPGGADDLNAAIADSIRRLARDYSVAAVGLAVAGFVSSDRGMVRYAPHLAWREADIAGQIAQRVALPVILEHDTNAAVLAEYRFGAAADARVTVLVALGTGIGGALIVDGNVYRGAHGVASELGHLQLVPDGRNCSCGKQGCWERYCSGTALAWTALERLRDMPATATSLAAQAAAAPGSVTGQRVAQAAREGDPAATFAMAELARWLGTGLALVADIYDPEVVVIGGGVADSASQFLSTAVARYAASVTGAGHRPLAEIRSAELGGNAGMVGAAELARDHVRMLEGSGDHS